MNIKLTIVLFFILANLFGCSPDNECFVADSVVPVKTIAVAGADYFIYLRISGLQEKEVFYELYKNKPMFNGCGKSSSLPISEAHIDLTEGAVSTLIIDNQALAVVYSKGKTQKIDFKDVQVEIKNR